MYRKVVQLYIHTHIYIYVCVYIFIYVYILFQVPFLYRSLQNIEYSSLG